MQDIYQIQNGNILITKNDIVYMDTVGNFKIDMPSAKMGNESYILYNRTLQQYVKNGDILPFEVLPELDNIIDGVCDIIVAKSKRIAVVIPEPTKAEKVAMLDAVYQPQFVSLAQLLGVATLDGNQTAITGIKEDYAALKAEYTSKMEVLV